ncbi:MULTISPECIES: cupredoxin domain-containing protein [Delftia]|uniref:Uncharacterized copper-binding protein, cupredoxin-like subfamily n=1 Tax=Delftia lacustris TaxID=558537 RepID=A0A1H3SIW9_9BURK|nr:MULTISPECIES: cupredoxin family protein [Delftia]EPD41092.1 hypothetical protein HMPREF9701_02124 [Delftia acidovorans CCUG 274B]SDZ37525.1 Uncharacterized copper-binding protein, cupredoxin-like subfamily [Delftia lacustris]
MTFTRFTISHVFAMAVLAASGAAFAAGNHAGGHAHGHGANEETAIGKPGVASKATRTINIDMADTMRFTPSSIQVKQGETVRFTVKNTGQVKHELSLGTEKELLEHLEQMRKFPDMEHEEPGKVTLAPGKQGEIVWQFTKAGTVNFACLIPGHYEAGMRGVVQVSKK